VLPHLWLDWDQVDDTGQAWSLAANCDAPELLRAGALVLAGPGRDWIRAVVTGMLVEEWRTLVWVVRDE
jgi:hypothetical protein